MAHSGVRINGLRGGTIGEITNFLTDFETAYNAIYAFDISIWRARRVRPRFELGIFWPSSDCVFLPIADHPEEIPPEDRLGLRAISIHSPGYWEFFGIHKILEQLRGYLNDRHQRRKDRDYLERSEKHRLACENELLWRQIAREDIAILKELGFDEREIRDAIWRNYGPAISKLGQHQDAGLIGGPEKEE